MRRGDEYLCCGGEPLQQPVGQVLSRVLFTQVVSLFVLFAQQRAKRPVGWRSMRGSGVLGGRVRRRGVLVPRRGFDPPCFAETRGEGGGWKGERLWHTGGGQGLGCRAQGFGFRVQGFAVLSPAASLTLPVHQTQFSI